jgi:hypothetical protein
MNAIEQIDLVAELNYCRERFSEYPEGHAEKAVLFDRIKRIEILLGLEELLFQVSIPLPAATIMWLKEEAARADRPVRRQLAFMVKQAEKASAQAPEEKKT